MGGSLDSHLRAKDPPLLRFWAQKCQFALALVRLRGGNLTKVGTNWHFSG